MDQDRTNDLFYANQAKKLRMGGAMRMYQQKSMRLREMEELGERVLNKHPDTLTDYDREFLEEYNALKEECDALWCMATTGSYPPGYVPKKRSLQAGRFEAFRAHEKKIAAASAGNTGGGRVGQCSTPVSTSYDIKGMEDLQA